MVKQVVHLLRKLFNSQEKIVLAKNSSWLIVEKVVNLLIGVFVTALIARYFGPTKYGLFNYALSFVALFTAISTLGLPNLTIQSLINKSAPENEILSTSFVLRLAGGAILTIIAYIIIIFIEDDPVIHTLVLIMSLTMMFKSFEIIEYWIQANQLIKVSSLIRIGSYVLLAMLKLLLILFNGNLKLYALLYAIDALIVGVLLFVSYRIISKKKFAFNFNGVYAVEILKKSWYLILAGLMVTAYMQIDKIMLGNMMSTKYEVGIYSAASTVAQMWYFVPLAIVTTFQPLILKRKIDNSQSSNNLTKQMYFIVFYIGLIFAIAISFLSTLIISILYGSDYIQASDVLLISVWAGIFATLGSARTVWLISENNQKYNLYFSAFGVTMNVILNALLIPNLGAYGAAVATLITQFSVSLIAPLMFKKTRESSFHILSAMSPKNILKLINTKEK